MDCCHPGTILHLPYTLDARDLEKESHELHFHSSFHEDEVELLWDDMYLIPELESAQHGNNSRGFGNMQIELKSVQGKRFKMPALPYKLNPKPSLQENVVHAVGKVVAIPDQAATLYCTIGFIHDRMKGVPMNKHKR